MGGRTEIPKILSKKGGIMAIGMTDARQAGSEKTWGKKNSGQFNITHPSSIKEALQVLDEALGGQNSTFKETMVNDYQHLRSQILAGTEKVSSKIKSNPWPIIGGVALGAFVLGVAASKNSNRRVET